MGKFKPNSFGNGERNGFNNPTITKSVFVDPAFDEDVNKKLDEFRKAPDHELRFPPMDRQRRKRVHELALKCYLSTHSTGNEPNRAVSVYKRRTKYLVASRSNFNDLKPIEMSEEAGDIVDKHLKVFPIKDRDAEWHLRYNSKPMARRTGITRMTMRVPPFPNTKDIDDISRQRQQLPSYACRNKIIDAIQRNTVVIITGGTGCGKTTQVPQFILEEAARKNEHLRIVCTQPRRLPAVAIAQRVAKERGESIGGTVGYHIRLEQKSSSETVLTYCTSGVLLRILSQDPTASHITHIIIDEIHERETNTDYLLIALKHALKKRKNLKIILMSATMEGNLALFANYFKDVSVETIDIKLKMFNVTKFYLDDVIAMTGHIPEPLFTNGVSCVDIEEEFPQMGLWSATPSLNQPPQKADWNTGLHPVQTMPNLQQGFGESSYHSGYHFGSFQNMAQNNDFNVPYSQMPEYYKGSCNSVSAPAVASSSNYKPNSYYNMPPQHAQYSNSYSGQSYQQGVQWTGGSCRTMEGEIVSEELMQAFQDHFGCVGPVMQPTHPSSSQKHWNTSGGSHFANQPIQNTPFYQPPQQQNMSGFGHSARGLTTSRSDTSFGQFNTKGFGAMTSADDFEMSMQMDKMREKSYKNDILTSFPQRGNGFSIKNLRYFQLLHSEQRKLAAKYRALGGGRFEDNVDVLLVAAAIRYCANSDIPGAILVFLPGYEDILSVREKLSKFNPEGPLVQQLDILTLHSQMNCEDQSRIFDRRPPYIRKVILSTNISEASLTIDDVIFVIDAGKAKEKVYDHESRFSQLKATTIAKSNAEQRAGRAGRVAEGFCLRLYTKKEYTDMPQTQVAEMQRTAIHDVCLHAKMFAPDGIRVADFLQMAPEPPALSAITQSLEFLEKLGALYSQSATIDQGETDQNRDPELTDLGRLIAQMPLDPPLARLLLFGLALKCLHPIVNLVALLSNRDPFMIPMKEERDVAHTAREAFACNNFSDHFMFIKVVDTYTRLHGRDQSRFCQSNYLHSSNMRMIQGVRKQLLLELHRAKVIEVEGDVTNALLDIEYNRFSTSWPVVQAAIVAGCYPGLGVIKGTSAKNKKIVTFASETATLHPSSVVKKHINFKGVRDSSLDPTIEYFAFNELAKIDEGLTTRTATVVPAVSVLLFGGSIRLKQSVINDYGLVRDEFEEDDKEEEEPRGFNDGEWYEIEPWLGVRSERKVLRRLLRIRFKFMDYFLQALEDPSVFANPSVEQIEMLEVLKMVLEHGHRMTNFNYPEMPKTGLLQPHKREKKNEPQEQPLFNLKVSDIFKNELTRQEAQSVQAQQSYRQKSSFSVRPKENTSNSRPNGYRNDVPNNANMKGFYQKYDENRPNNSQFPDSSRNSSSSFNNRNGSFGGFNSGRTSVASRFKSNYPGNDFDEVPEDPQMSDNNRNSQLEKKNEQRQPVMQLKTNDVRMDPNFSSHSSSSQQRENKPNNRFNDGSYNQQNWRSHGSNFRRNNSDRGSYNEEDRTDRRPPPHRFNDNNDDRRKEKVDEPYAKNNRNASGNQRQKGPPRNEDTFGVDRWRRPDNGPRQESDNKQRRGPKNNGPPNREHDQRRNGSNTKR